MAGDLDLRGVWIPLITPFAADGSVDVAAIERLCASPELLTAMSCAALAKSADFTWDRSIDTLEHILHDAVAGHRGGA